MSKFWQILLGIERSPGTVVGGDTRLEFTAMPRGAGVLAVVLAAALLLALIWWLYRREGRSLSRARRSLLVGLRVLTLLALAAMLVEPVLITSRRETVKSHLMLVLDDSESMKFSDPYTDASRAVEI